MRAFDRDVTTSDILRSCELSLGLPAEGLRIRQAPHPLDEAGTKAFVVESRDGVFRKVISPGEDSSMFH